ncbi:MAG: hypothetical protein U0807_09040 [Candidatus Binatia bacterium]
MMSNCSLHPLAPIDPSIDPAYADGPPPRPHPDHAAGVIEIAWPFAQLPERLRRRQTISIETLEDMLERDAEREEEWA